MNLKTLLALGLSFCGLTRIGTVSAEPSETPFKFRVNKEVLKKVLNSRDQEIFQAIKDQKVSADDEDVDLEYTNDITFSFGPSDGIELEDWDLDVHYEKEYMGAETDKVKVTGTATLKDGTEVEFTAPVPLVKLQYELGTQYNKEYKFDALHFNEKEWTFNVGDVEGEGLSNGAKQEINNVIVNKMNDFKQKFEKAQSKSKDGLNTYVKDFPMDTVIPMACIYYVVHFAEVYHVNEKFVEMGFSLQHWKMLTDKQNNMLKKITTEFYNDQQKDGYDALIQFSVDDNMFNSFSAVFTSIEKSFSARDMMKGNPKLKPMINTMKTSVIAAVIPTFTEEYGADNNLDVMFSPSHSLFLNGIPNAKMSGIYIDKNGNWKIQANFIMNLNVETSKGVWESARDIYMTVVFKFKIAVDGSNPFRKKFSFTPKNFEVTNLKVNKDDTYQEMESMMIQSVVNIQMENLKKEFKEFPFYLNDILSKNPKELQCLGFNIADFDIAFKKSQAQFSAYYKPTKYANKELCDKFFEELRQSPNKIIDQFNAEKNNPFMKALQESQKVAAGDKTADPFGSMGQMGQQMGAAAQDYVKPTKNTQKRATGDEDTEHVEL